MATERRLIDANTAMVNTYNEVWWTESEAAAVRSFLVRQKTVDAVEVVRCKYCKWRNKRGCPYMNFNSSAREDFDFCSDGERENGGGSNGI